MYIVIISIFIVLILFFWSSIQILVKTMTNSSLQNGYMWFLSLLIINVIIIVFIYGYYFYQSNQPGKSGIPGMVGLTGYEGDQCYFSDSCSNPNTN
jgi:hypothetical protein